MHDAQFITKKWRNDYGQLLRYMNRTMSCGYVYVRGKTAVKIKN